MIKLLGYILEGVAIALIVAGIVATIRHDRKERRRQTLMEATAELQRAVREFQGELGRTVLPIVENVLRRLTEMAAGLEHHHEYEHGVCVCGDWCCSPETIDGVDQHATTCRGDGGW